MKFKQIVGSIAGDDTIMMALKTNEDAVKVYKEIKSVIEE
jgi:transcriptional regulator of arginine metabolism